jgi:hypothetical protein
VKKGKKRARWTQVNSASRESMLFFSGALKTYTTLMGGQVQEVPTQ